MRKYWYAGLLAFALLTGPDGESEAYAQTRPTASAPAPAPAALPDADPALWVVRDEDTTIYLFGTFHLLDGRPWLNDEVKAAFDASNELVLEAIIPDNPAELQPLVMRYAVDQQGRRLSQRLTAEQNATLGQALSSVGAPPTAFDSFEPWFVSMTVTALASQKLGINAANGPEGVLMRAARDRNVAIAELEGLEWQIRLFDNMPDDQQLAQLKQTLDNYEEIDEQMAPMLAAWSSGDVDGLVEIINRSGESDPTLHRILFTERNATWARWIQERLARPGTIFLAVGAGHLAGSDSVQTALQARGLRAERVPHQEDSSPTS